MTGGGKEMREGGREERNDRRGKEESKHTFFLEAEDCAFTEN